MNIVNTCTVEYLDHMGSDLTVVNAARASFGKESAWDERYATEEEFAVGEGAMVRKLKEADASLIRFLATGYRAKEWDELLAQVRDVAVNGSSADLTDLLHAYKRKAQHWAPFGHPHVQLRLSMPLFLARQFVKHQVGGVWSEESRRYISDEPDVYFPTAWHTRPDDIKQGSGDFVEDQSLCRSAAANGVYISLVTYRALLNAGTAPEEARMVLPLNMMTTVVWTGSLLFWSRVVNQRFDSHAQLAAQELAAQISAITAPLYPVSWAALTGHTV